MPLQNRLKMKRPHGGSPLKCRMVALGKLHEEVVRHARSETVSIVTTMSSKKISGKVQSYCKRQKRKESRIYDSRRIWNKNIESDPFFWRSPKELGEIGAKSGYKQYKQNIAERDREYEDIKAQLLKIKKEIDGNAVSTTPISTK